MTGINSSKTVWALVFALGTLVGCQREQVQVRQIPKEKTERSLAAAPQGAPMPPNHPAAASEPVIQWKVPTGWVEKERDGMRMGSFSVTNNAGKSADISIIPIFGGGGGELGNVNRWRAQVGLPAVTAEELPKQWQGVPVGNATGKLLDIVGTNVALGDRVHMLAAILNRAGTAWFFKMTGDDPLVTEQKPNFLALLKSVEFGVANGQPAAPLPMMTEAALPKDHPPIGNGASMMQPSSVPPSATNASKPSANLPPGWQEQAPKPMQTARYVVKGASGEAEVSLAELAGEGGGALPNVNRWRQQIGLDDIGQDEFARLATSLDVRGTKATLVDMTNEAQRKRLIAVILPRGPATLFYKLVGDPAVVGQQKDALTKFIQSAP